MTSNVKDFIISVILAIVVTICVLVWAFVCEAGLVEIARAELGHGECGGNNLGPDIQRYFRGTEGKSWCAAFVSYCLLEAGITDLGYQTTARQILNEGRELGWEVKEPQAGDLIVFWRKNPQSWQGHIEIVEQVKGNRLITIAGNVGKYPAKVKRIEYDLAKIPKLLGFIRPGKGQK